MIYLFSVLILFGILLGIQVMDEMGGTWSTNWEMRHFSAKA
jgi:hypothetical protein